MTAPTVESADRTTKLEKELADALRELARYERLPRLGLVWEDQREAVEDLMETHLPVLTEVPERRIREAGETRPHLLIEGDNLHALACLRYTHTASVDLCYIDPPYNTGKEFRYNDKLVDKEDSWRHSKWLSFMHRRLTLAAALLKDSGLIMLSIDEHEQAHLRLLCDQVFGASNFVAQLVWKGKSGGQDSSGFARLHEYVLVYAKDKRRLQVGRQLQEGGGKYPRTHPITGRRHKRQLVRKWGSNDRREDRPNLYFSVTAPDGTQCFPTRPDGTDGCWRWGAARFAREAAEGNVEFELKNGAWVPYQLQWADAEVPATAPYPTVLPDSCGTTAHGTRVLSAVLGAGTFDYPKPPSLISHLLEMSGAPADAVVLDFFAGSGTTGHAVAELNDQDGGTRQAILVTNNENAICDEVTWPRMRNVLTGQWETGAMGTLPGALRFYRCAFVEVSTGRDAMLRRLANRAGDLVAIKEGAFDEVRNEPGRYRALIGPAKTVVVWCDWANDDLDTALAASADTADKVLYLFSFDDKPDPAVIAAHPDWRVEALPEPILAALRRAHRRSAR